MKVEMTEPTNYEESDNYFEPVEVKQSDDISAEVDVNTKLINSLQNNSNLEYMNV